MILLIDNYDSFTYNLYQYMGIFEKDIKVVRNDKITIEKKSSGYRTESFFHRDRKVRKKPKFVWT